MKSIWRCKYLIWRDAQIQLYLLFIKFSVIFYYQTKTMKKQKRTLSTSKSTINNNSSLSKFNNSLLFSQLKEVESKENKFLKIKNNELQQNVLKMGEYIIQLQNDKNNYLELNSQYITVMNQNFSKNHTKFEQTIKGSEKFTKMECSFSVLEEFEKDYRNLIRHCTVLEQQIKAKNIDITKYEAMKAELKEVNHESVTQIVRQLKQVTDKLVNQRQENNKLSYEIQKYKSTNEKVRKHKQLQQESNKAVNSELQTYKSLINTIQNESKDKENRLKSKIYQLEVTIQKQQKQLRGQQKFSNSQQKRVSKLCVQRVERVHQNTELRRSLSYAKKLVNTGNNNILQKKKSQLKLEKKHSFHIVTN